MPESSEAVSLATISSLVAWYVTSTGAPVSFSNRFGRSSGMYASQLETTRDCWRQVGVGVERALAGGRLLAVVPPHAASTSSGGQRESGERQSSRTGVRHGGLSVLDAAAAASGATGVCGVPLSYIRTQSATRSCAGCCQGVVFGL